MSRTNDFIKENNLDEIIEQLKKNVHDELIADGQSEKYFKTMWTVWWGLMGTDIQMGLLKTIKELNEKIPSRCEYNGKTSGKKRF